MKLLINLFLCALLSILAATSILSQSLTNDKVNGLEDIQIGSSINCQKRLAMDYDSTRGYSVFVWQESTSGAGNKEIYGGIYDRQLKLVKQFVVNKTTAGDQAYPQIKVLKNSGAFVVVWSSFINNTNTSDPNQYDIYAKKIRYDYIDADIAANDLLINSNYVTGNQISPCIAVDPAFSEVIIAWIDQNGRDRLPTVVSTDYGSYARRVSYAGSALSLVSGSDDFRINGSVTTSHQSVTGIEVSPVTGELYTVCHSLNYPGGNDYDIIFRKFSRGTGGAYTGGTETIVNTSTASTLNTSSGLQSNPSIVINSITGDYAISWQSNFGSTGYDSYSKIFNKQNQVVKGDFKVAPFVTDNNELAPKAIWDELSGTLFYFFWYSEGNLVTIKYTVFDKTFTNVQTEKAAISRNLNDYYAGMYNVRYDQAWRKVLLFYDAFGTSSSISSAFVAKLNYTAPKSSSTSVQNYIETITPFKSIQDETLLDNIPVRLAQVGRTYYDGLGRPIQTVDIQGSPLRKDVVQPMEYDKYGRQVKFYLPYVNGSEDGGYQYDFTGSQAGFYMNLNADKVVNDLYPYHEVVYESSVANQTSETSAPGESYKIGSGHTAKTYELMNTTADGIRKWTLSAGDAVSGSAYSSLTLIKTSTVDAGGKTWETYSEKSGKVVCKKEIPVGCTTAACALTTYYVYDFLDQLRFIIPPQATAEMATAGYNAKYNGTSNVDLMVFAYKYDKYGRVIEKKLPGQSLIYVVYNKLGQVVLTQDGNQRASNQWTFSKYDLWGRVIMTGVYVDTRTVDQLRTDVGSISACEKRYYANSTGYTNDVSPVINEADVHTITFYDDYNYDFDGNPNVTQSYIASGLSPEPQPSSQTLGKVTGTKVKILGTTSWLISINYYDNKGRLIQQISNNQKNSSLNSHSTNLYSYDGKIIQNKTVTVTPLNTITIITRNEYDETGRLVKTYQKNNTDPEVLVAQFRYNELDQMVEKNLHSENNGGAFLQSVDYTYNVNGSMTHINNSTLSNTAVNMFPSDNNDDTNDLWGMEFAFDKTIYGISSTPVYNGKISAVTWKSNNSSLSTAQRAVKFSYDGLYRYSESSFSDNSSGSFQFGNKYRETGLTYDQNGNILTLNRYNKDGTLIDNLEYNYTGTGNQLKSVKDNSAVRDGFPDRSTLASEYTYDLNGNTLSDANKGITSIVYNHLNLPTKIVFGSDSKNWIEYTYDARGTRLGKKIVKNGDVNYKRSDYVKGLLYENDVLKQFAFAEGRVVPATSGSASFSYEYTLKDHLGNSRLIFSNYQGSPLIIQEDNYYAMGMPMGGSLYKANSNTNNFLYNGCEIQEGIDTNDDLQKDYDLETYDYGMRMYDPAIGRWNGSEPLAEQFNNTSLYVYADNDPVNKVDIGGAYATWGVNSYNYDLSRSIGSSLNRGINGMMQQNSLQMGLAKGEQWAVNAVSLQYSQRMWASEQMANFYDWVGNSNYGRPASIFSGNSFGDVFGRTMQGLLEIAPVSGPLIGFARAARSGNIGAAVANGALFAVDVAVFGGIRSVGRQAYSGSSEIASPTYSGNYPTNQDLIQSIANRAEANIGGVGKAAGNAKHAYAEEMLNRYQRLYGDRGLQTEVQYFNGELALPDAAFSSKADVWEAATGTVYDYKFSANPMTVKQYYKYLNNMPGVTNIVTVHPTFSNFYTPGLTYNMYNYAVVIPYFSE